MDENKFAFPSWLPWATTACLAIVVACLGEILVIEKARTQLVRDDNFLIQATLKASQNQLEAERIVHRRELQQLRSAPGVRVAFLSAPHRWGTSSAPWGVATWDPTGRHAVLRCSGLPGLAADHDYQVWIEAPGATYPISCGVFHADAVEAYPLDLPSPIDPAYRILLIDGKKGGSATLAEAESAGPIVLATPIPLGKITD
jgi:hypothetical protein